MAKYRKKPVVIEATQWFKNGDHPLDYDAPADAPVSGAWEGKVVRYYRTPSLDGQSKCKHCGDIMHNHGWIDTLEGGHNVCPGDWIITGVNGEHYPCKPDIFAKTYDLVEAAEPGDVHEAGAEMLNPGKRQALLLISDAENNHVEIQVKFTPRVDNSSPAHRLVAKIVENCGMEKV